MNNIYKLFLFSSIIACSLTCTFTYAMQSDKENVLGREMPVVRSKICFLPFNDIKETNTLYFEDKEFKLENAHNLEKFTAFYETLEQDSPLLRHDERGNYDYNVYMLIWKVGDTETISISIPKRSSREEIGGLQFKLDKLRQNHRNDNMQDNNA